MTEAVLLGILGGVALLLGLCAVALIWALDRPDDYGRVTDGWLRRDRERQ